jgi:hypothetical protein
MDAMTPRRDDIELIIIEANRTKDIVQGLLSFARETKLKPGTPISTNSSKHLGLLVNSHFSEIK